MSKVNVGKWISDLLLYIGLGCIGGAIGVFISRMSTVTAVVAATGALLIWVLSERLIVPFYFSALSVLLLHEVDITPGSFLSIFENIKRPGVPSVIEISMILLTASFLLKKCISRERLTYPVITAPFVLFCCLYCISLYVGFTSNNNEILLKEDSKKFMFPIIFFIASINVLTTRKQISYLSRFVAAFAVLKSCLGIISYFRGVGFEYGDSNVIFIETADLILVVTVMVAIVAKLVFCKNNWKTIFIECLMLVPLLFSLIYSNRRNAWLGILLAFTLLFLLSPGNYKPRIVLVLLGVVLAGGVMVICAMALRGLPSGDDLRSRFASISDKSDKSNEAHVNEWTVTLEALKQHPVLGLGFGSEHAPVPGDDTINRHTVHNGFLMLYMKMGLLPLLLFSWCMWRYFIFCAQHKVMVSLENLEYLRLGLFSTFAYWLVTLNVAPSWWYYREMCMIALVMAIVIRLTLISCSDIDPERNGQFILHEAADEAR